MSEPKEYDDRCPACGLSSSAWEESCDELFHRYEAITHEAVLAERERVLARLDALLVTMRRHGVPFPLAALEDELALIRGAK